MIDEKQKSSRLHTQYNPNDIFHIQLTVQEMHALNTLLPLRYSFQIDTRRKQKSIKKKTADQLLINNQQISKSKNNISNIHSEPVKKQTNQKTEIISQALKPCLKILQMLQQHKCGWPFLQPVDAQGLNIPQYRQIVKQPMDLSTIESKLKSGKYQLAQQFHYDVTLIFNNSYLFNEANEDFIKLTNEFQRYYYRISGQTKPVQQKIQVPKQNNNSKSQKKKKKTQPGSRQNNDSLPMTTQQKKQLAINIQRLAKQHIKGVKGIIFDNNTQQNEFDLQQISQKKLKQLQKYIKNKINEMQQNSRANLSGKTQQQNLDEMQSQISQQFIIQSL